MSNTENGHGRVGPKGPVDGGSAVASSQHPIVTETMLSVLADGGNAVDAGIAACLVQAVVQQDMTNHTGTVNMLFFEAATGQVHELNSQGTIVPDKAPVRPVPPGFGLYATALSTPMAVIPGFMPGLKAMYERFGTKPWEQLCEPAITWAEEGHMVGSFEHLVMAQTVDFFLHSESGRAHFTPEGFLPQVGDRWPRPELAATMRNLAKEGPDYFINGEWAKHFVERGNSLGWDISLADMSRIPPRWGSGLRWQHKGHEIVQLSPPERGAVHSAIVLGVLDELDVTSLGHYTESPEALYYMAHALRRAAFETGLINDPAVFEDPSSTLLSRDFHRQIADVLRQSRPRIDMTNHVHAVAGPNALVPAGGPIKQPAGSCELSIVDRDGNWVQMMNTLQSGGIPGEVVDGVPMVGSHALSRMDAPIAGWFTGGGRLRCVIGNTLVLRDGKPWLSMGTPGNVHCTMPQVLSNVLDYGMDPYAAEDAPRMNPMGEDHTLEIESRISSDLVAGMAELGIQVKPLPRYDYHMGSFQMSWRDEAGGLHTCTGPRRAGVAGSI